MKNVMTYKGYMARMEFDQRDNVFMGKIIGIVDSITFYLKYERNYLLNLLPRPVRQGPSRKAARWRVWERGLGLYYHSLEQPKHLAGFIPSSLISKGEFHEPKILYPVYSQIIIGCLCRTEEKTRTGWRNRS